MDDTIPISEAAFWLGLSFATVIAGAVLQRSRRKPVHALGWLTTALGFILAASSSFVLLRWRLDGYPRAVPWLVVLGFDALLVIATIAILRTTRSFPSRSRRSDSPPPSSG